MLQEFVAADFSKSYKRRSSSSLSSISLSFLSPFSTLFRAPVVRIEFTDRAFNMGTSDIKASPVKPTNRMRRAVSTAPSMRLEPSTASSESHTRSISSAMRDVRRLPRKASRIVCMPGLSCGKPHSPGDECPSAVHGSRESSWRSGHGVSSMGAAKERAAAQAVSMERSGSQGSSGTGSISIGTSTNSSSYVHGTSVSSATSVTGSGSVKSTRSKGSGAGRNHTVLSGPIMTPEELAKALERQSLETQRSPAPNSASHASGWDTTLPAPNNNNHTINFPDAENTTLEDDNFVPRPLSPPNFHFRRQRVTSETGSIVEPYTSPSPMHSPPGSPHFVQHQPQLRLHEVLSSEDLLASRMQLYNGALEPGDDDCDSQRGMWDAKSVKSDIGFGFSTRHRTLSQCSPSPSTSGHTGAYSPNTRREGREKISSYSTVRSHTRLRHPGVLVREEDTNELRRVFSR